MPEPTESQRQPRQPRQKKSNSVAKWCFPCDGSPPFRVSVGVHDDVYDKIRDEMSKGD